MLKANCMFNEPFSVLYLKDKHMAYEVIMPERVCVCACVCVRAHPFQPLSQVTDC